MKNKTLLRVILLLGLIGQSFAISSLTDKKDDYCSSTESSFSEETESFKELNKLRRERDNTFTDDYKDIIEFLRDPKDNYEDLLDGARWSFSLLVALIALVLISFIIFLVFCIVGCKSFQGESGKLKTFTLVSCFLFWVVTLLFVVVIVMLSLAQHELEDMLCTIFKLPSALLDGIGEENTKFIGLTPLLNSLTAFSQDMDSFGSKTANMVNIQSAQLDEKSGAAWSKINNFVFNVETASTTNGRGIKEVPFSITSMTPGLNDAISSEFLELDLAAVKVTNSATIGLQYANTIFRTNQKAAIQTVNTELTQIIQEIETFADSGTDNVDKAVDHVRWGYWMIFGLISFILALVGFVLLILCSVSRKFSSSKLRKGKLLLVIIALLIFVFSFYVFLLFIGTAGISGLCGAIFKLNRDQVSVLYEFTGYQQTVRDIAETCLFTNSTGSLVSLASGTSTAAQIALTDTASLLDGFSEYRKFHNSTSVSRNSVETQKLADGPWTRYQNGSWYDHENIKDTLDDFNDIIDCNDEYFEFHINACNGKTKCKSIIDTPTYTVPSCAGADTARADFKFKNLKKYITEEMVLFDGFKNVISNQANPTSATSLYRNALDALIGANTDVAQLELQLPTPLGPTRMFNETFSNLMDCKGLRRLSLQLERKTCFEFGWYLYIMLVVVCVILVLLLFLSWTLCCAINIEKVEEEPPKPVQPVEHVDFDDKEKVPFY